MVSRVDTTSLEARTETNNSLVLGSHTDGAGRSDQDRDLILAGPDVEDPVEDLADLLTWAREVGVIDSEEIDLLIELLAAENDGHGPRGGPAPRRRAPRRRDADDPASPRPHRRAAAGRRPEVPGRHRLSTSVSILEELCRALSDPDRARLLLQT